MRLALHSTRRLLLDLDSPGAEDAREHRVIGLDAMMLSYALILLVLCAVAAERFKLPASSAAILLGAAFGGIFRAAGIASEEHEMIHSNALITFDEELFLYVLLPPIIFEAGFSLSRRHFFDNLATILLFAVAGTIITTFVIGQTIYAAGSAQYFVSKPSGYADALDFTTPLDSYLFGALISATDPVATLSIMGAVNADPIVYTLIFGESVLNDAVAIVLVRILEDMGRLGFSNPGAYVNGILQFFAVSFGSLLVGLAVSAASAILLNRCDLTHHPSFELSIVLLVGYAAYATAEASGGSGILALFATGVLCGHYHVQSLSEKARDAAGVTLKALAHLAETAVFAYMGVDLFAMTGSGVSAFAGAHKAFNSSMAAAAGVAGGAAAAASPPSAPPSDGGVESGETANIIGFVFFALLVVILARVVVILPLCLLANCFRGRGRTLSRRAMAMLVFAGLRGAIAFALAHNVHSEHRHAIAAATTTVVLATVFVLGGATRTVLRILRMEADSIHTPPTSPGRSGCSGDAAGASAAGGGDASGGGGGADGTDAIEPPAEDLPESEVSPRERPRSPMEAAAAAVKPSSKRAQRRAMNREQKEPLARRFSGSLFSSGGASDDPAHANGGGGGGGSSSIAAAVINGAAGLQSSDSSGEVPRWAQFDEKYLQPIFGNRRARVAQAARRPAASVELADVSVY